MRLARALVLVSLGGTSIGCVDTGQDRVAIPLLVGGALERGPIDGAGGFVIELERADLAFGPLYLCAGVLAGDNCQTARLEWLDSVTIDVLSPALVEAGLLTGVTGPLRSGMYDLGIASLSTLPEPLVLAAAESLEGNSIRLSGAASRDTESVSFDLELPIQQGDDAEIGVSVVRLSNVPGLEHDVTGRETALNVRFDPRPWVSDIDFAAALGTGAGADGAALRFGSDSQAARALRAALLSGPRPSFEWTSAPTGSAP